MTDSPLIDGLRRGDVASFEAIFREYYPRLCGFAHGYLADRSACEDVVQDLFTAIWEKRRRLDIRTSLKAYLFGALRNRLLNKSARLKLEQQWFQREDIGDDVIADGAPLADALLQSSDTSARLRAAVDSLPPGCRTIVKLRFEEEMSYAEIAEAVGVAPKTVENQLARARKLLRERLPDVIE